MVGNACCFAVVVVDVDAGELEVQALFAENAKQYLLAL